MLASTSAAATDFYVRPEGSDAHDGLSPATAFASIRHAAAQILNAGDRVIVAPGTYAEGDIGPARNGIATRPVAFLADTTGALTGTAPGPVQISVPAERSTGFLLLGRKGVTIDGFSISGASDACVQTRVSADGLAAPESIVLRNLVATGCAKRGIDVTAVGSVTVENSIVSGNNSGITVMGPGDAGREEQSALGQPQITVRNNEVRDHATLGMFFERVAGATVVGNVVEDNFGTGILVRSSNGLLLEDNRVAGNRDGGIVAGRGVSDAAAVADITLLGNHVEANVGAALVVVASGAVRIDGNAIIDPFSSSIFVRGLTLADVLIVANELPAGPLDGILVEDAAVVRIERHVLEDSAENAILVRRSGDVEIADNVILRPRVKAVYVEGDGSVAIRSNRVVDSRGSSISVVSEQRTATVSVSQNEVLGSEANGVLVTGAASVLLERNVIDTSGFVGANLTSVAAATVNENSIRRSAQDAVRITGGGPVVARNNVFADNPDSGFLLESDIDKTFQLDLTGNAIHAHAHGIFVRGCSGGRIKDNAISASRLDAVLLRRCSGIAIVGNQFTNNGRTGVAINTWTEPYGRDFSLRRNRIHFSGGPGVQVYARGNVVATRNDIRVAGSTGLSIETGGRARVMLSNNEVVAGGAHGVFVTGASKGLLQNSIVHSHGDTGVTLRHSPNMLVANNLIYANRTDGLAIGTGNGPSPNPIVLNNTLYANDGRGFVLGSGSYASPGGVFMNNIVEANAGTGIAIDRPSAERLNIAFNMNSDGYGPDTPRSPFDLVGPAGFRSPAGADGRLGGMDDGDDDFRVRQERGGQDSDGRAIDAGSADTEDIGLTGSTAANGVADIGKVDLGFHYGADLRQSVRPAQAFVALYVRAGGDDANSGRTASEAFGSIRRAALQGITGATVIVGPGVYVERDPIRIRRGADRVTFLADPLGSFTGDAPGPVVVDADGGETGFIVLEATDVVIDGFHVRNAATAGIQIRAGGERAVVRNNVVFSNSRRGIEVRGADDAVIDNNLVYANGTGGIQLQQTRGSSVTGNTVYGNGENGVTVGGGLSQVAGLLDGDHPAGAEVVSIRLAAPTQVRRFFAGDAVRFAGDPGYYRVPADAVSVDGLLALSITPPLGSDLPAGSTVSDETLAAIETRVQRNIVAANAVGIQVRMNSMQGYQCGYNVVPSGLPVQVPFAGQTPRCDSDLIADPILVQPAGADGLLGASGFADDDFRLVQDHSPAVDLAPCDDELPGVPGTTHSASLPDECPIDAGYHYPLPDRDAWAN